jgi:hypothetical protein
VQRTQISDSPRSTKSMDVDSHEEGSLTRIIENQTSKIPSATFLALAVGSMALSLGLAATRENKSIANFVGLWSPTFLLLGIYNKIVKTHGSDARHKLN